MDFDDLTQHLLVAFLRNSTTDWAHLTRHDGYLARHSLVQGQDHPLPSMHSTTGQWSSIVTIVSPLPTPQRFQSESAAQIQDFLPYGEQTNGHISENGTWTSDATISRLFLFDFVLGIFLAIITIFTIIGNALVIAAILQERHLRSVGNYLVFSLAVADLMVACLVMPLGALVVVTGEWTLGARLCDLWTVADVLCCTASILHLLAIAMDRYWAVTNVDYIHQRRNSNRIGLMIFLIWAASLIISLAPLLGWRDPGFPERIANKECLISQDVTYQLFATCASFYVPLLLILLLYWRIYQVARKRIRRKPGNKVTMVTMQSASNASNVNVETKVLKDKAMGVSKTSRKLAKYSAAKYLQKQGARLNSDMMSLETDCLHNSADSFASTESPNGSANRHANSPFGRHQDDGSHSTTLHSKKLSISSIARTTTTSISMANPSDLSTCSSFGMSPNGQTSSNRLLLCSKVESSIGGYSIITEEGSSSSSSAQPPLTSLHVLENVPEPEVNEHSPLPLPSLAFAHHSNGTIWTEPVDYSICPCDRADCINSICINESTRKHKKRFSMVVSKENGYGVLCPPPRTKSMSMCSNDANQNALCDGEQVGALASRYRAQSNDSIAKKAPSYGALGHCALSCDESASPVAATVVVAFSANDALYCKPMNDQLASDSHLIAIDTNYGHQFGENKHSTEMEGTTEKRNDSLGDTSQPLTSNDPDRQSRGQMTPSCNHAANGGLGNHMGTTSQPCSPSPPTDEQPCNKPAKGVSLKEDSTSSSFGSAAANPPSPKCNHKQHKKHKCPLKQSSQHSNPSPSPHQSRLYQKESIESKRERKAAKTLAIITGLFVACWLPFFINALLSPLSETYRNLIPEVLTGIFLWLGYINSCINPIIYVGNSTFFEQIHHT